MYKRQADNATRQEWNRTADMALVSGIEEAKIDVYKRQVFPLLCCGVHTALHCTEARGGLPAGSERRHRQ